MKFIVKCAVTALIIVGVPLAALVSGITVGAVVFWRTLRDGWHDIRQGWSK